MKVIFTIDSLANSGTEKSLLELIQNFTDEIEVTVVYFYPVHKLLDKYVKAGINVKYLGIGKKVGFLKRIERFTKLIRTEKPDLVVSSLLRTNIISRVACKLTKTRIVGTFVSDSYSDVRLGSYKLKRRVGFKLMYRLDRLTAYIPMLWISNSESIKGSNCKRLSISADKVKVIYRGRSVPEKWQSPSHDQEFVFVFIGRLLITKGVIELIDSFGNLYMQHKHIRLHIYGEGNSRTVLEEQIRKLDLTTVVTLFGDIPNANFNFYKSHCFVFPSWYEGFSGALVEAMMTGIPIIASDIPMNLEAITNGVNAYVFKVKNIIDLHRAMQEVLNDYEMAVQMGCMARETAISRFNIKYIADQYQRFLLYAYNLT